MSDTLVGFLLARIAEDEADARDTDPLMPGAVFDHDVSGWWRTDRVLAECEAKRRIVERARSAARWAATEGEADYADDGQEYAGAISAAWQEALSAIALPYAGHPDFRPEWAPQG